MFLCNLLFTKYPYVLELLGLLIFCCCINDAAYSYILHICFLMLNGCLFRMDVCYIRFFYLALGLISVCLVTYLILKIGTFVFLFSFCYVFQFGVKTEVTIFN